MSELIKIDRLMGCTIDELLIWLPAASHHKKFEVVRNSQGLEVSFPDDGIYMHGLIQPSRQIALLSIPVVLITFSFNEKWSKLSVDQFMSRFDLYTRRGGG
jgi:hypothetical protein